jgi:hypothetical protein
MWFGAKRGNKFAIKNGLACKKVCLNTLWSLCLEFFFFLKILRNTQCISIWWKSANSNIRKWRLQITLIFRINNNKIAWKHYMLKVIFIDNLHFDYIVVIVNRWQKIFKVNKKSTKLRLMHAMNKSGMINYNKMIK